MFQKFINWFQFTNIFIALCAVSFSFANLSFFREFKTPKLLFITIFLGVVWYYNLAYQKIIVTNQNYNQRTLWFVAHKKQLFTIQAILLSCIAIFCFILSPNLANFFDFTTLWHQLFLVSFIIIGLLYNFGLINKSSSISIRKIAFLKPLFIGYVWMGVTLVFPFVFNAISNHQILNFNYKFWIIFTEGLFFIALLAILYDVKDFEADNAVSLKTWVVKLGINKLHERLILPAIALAIAAIFMLLQMQLLNNKIAITIILSYLIIVIISKIIQQKKSIIWHLTLIDGVILLKSVALILLNKI